MESKTKQFQKKINISLGKEYVVLGDYVNNKTHILMRHSTCGHEWKCLPMTLTRKKPTRCPNCFGTPKKNTSVFKKEVKNITNGEYVVVGEYKTTNTKVEIKHVTCGNVWEITPNRFLNLGNRCPKCSGIGDSLAIKSIKDFLILKDIYFEEEKRFDDCRNKRPLPFDIFVPSFNLVIEYDGIQHFKNVYGINRLKACKRNDIIKNEWVKMNKDISILRIDYSHQRSLVKILDSVLFGVSATTIEKYNLYYIGRSSKLINDNGKYTESIK